MTTSRQCAGIAKHHSAVTYRASVTVDGAQFTYSSIANSSFP